MRRRFWCISAIPDFANRYHLLAENIDQWRASAGSVDPVDLRFARQVVVNPESRTVAANAAQGALSARRKAGRKTKSRRNYSHGFRVFGEPPLWAQRNQRERRIDKKDKYLVALDVGSTKTCAVISEVDEKRA